MHLVMMADRNNRLHVQLVAAGQEDAVVDIHVMHESHAYDYVCGVQDEGLAEGPEGSLYWKGMQGRKELIRCGALFFNI